MSAAKPMVLPATLAAPRNEMLPRAGRRAGLATAGGEVGVACTWAFAGARNIMKLCSMAGFSRIDGYRRTQAFLKA